MNHSTFLKNRFSVNLKQLIDAPYLVAFFFIAFFYTLAEVILACFTWKEKIANLAPHLTSNLLLLQILILFLICFCNLLFSGVIFRFCVGMLLNKTQTSMQRLCALVLSLAYFFTSTHLIYPLIPSALPITFQIPIFHFIFFVFIGLALAYQFLTARAVQWGEKSRYICIFLVIGALLTTDWWLVTERRKHIEKNLSGTEIVYLFTSQAKDAQAFLESSEFRFLQEKFNLKTEKITAPLQDTLNRYLTQTTPLYASNIGTPSPLLLNSNQPGVICKNTEKDIFWSFTLKYALPVANLVPNHLLLKGVPDLFCLYLQNDLPRINLLDIYNGILKLQTPQKTILSLVDMDRYSQEVTRVFQNMEIIQASFNAKDVKLKIYFTRDAPAETLLFSN